VRDGQAAAGGSRLRAARQARGFSQQELARLAAVSRQTVWMVEAGISDPTLRVALALAGALGMRVEELFESADAVVPVTARPVAPLGGTGARVMLAPMGDGSVAFPLRGATAGRVGFLPAGGLVAGTGRGHKRMSNTVRPIGPPRLTLVAAGCDPALPLLEAPLALLDPPVAFAWWQCPSRQALKLAAAGLVHVAGTHLRGPGSSYNITRAAGLLPEGGEVIGFGSWREGLALRPELADRISGIQDVADSSLRLVNREPGAEARRLLDRALAGAGIEGRLLPGYDTRAAGHLDVVSAIAAGLADAGIAMEPAARTFGLGFIPLAEEHFDLVIPAGQISTREVQGLLKVLSSAWLVDQLAGLPGYDPGRCGELIATLPWRDQGNQPSPDDR
jgi:molybdate-binding protein/DNA-binding XRE family transcriptional regulator